MLEKILGCTESNLFDFILHSLGACCQHLGITTPIRRSSDIAIEHALKSQEKVLAICHATGARQYLNAIGGVELYQRDTFLEQGIELQFIRARLLPYPQFGAPFVPWLSIIDVMMFNSPEAAPHMSVHQGLRYRVGKRRIVEPACQRSPALLRIPGKCWNTKFRIVLSQLVAALPDIQAETISVCSSLSH